MVKIGVLGEILRLISGSLPEDQGGFTCLQYPIPATPPTPVTPNTLPDPHHKSDWATVLSGVPQGTVLGPLLFSLYINDISTDIDSEIRLFADDCLLWREIKDTEDTLKLQKAIDQLGCWARKWGMRFQPVKCNMMQITRKRIKKIHASYTLEGKPSKKSKASSFLGSLSQMICDGMHVSNIYTKANRTLGFLRRNLYSCQQELKEAAYKGLVCPVLEYSGSVWDPSGVGLQNELEKVQN